MLVWFWDVTKMTRLRSQRVFSCTQKTALAPATPYNLILKRSDFRLFGCKLVELMVLCRSGGMILSLLPSDFGIFLAPQIKLHWPLLWSFWNWAIWLLESSWINDSDYVINLWWMGFPCFHGALPPFARNRHVLVILMKRYLTFYFYSYTLNSHSQLGFVQDNESYRCWVADTANHWWFQ